MSALLEDLWMRTQERAAQPQPDRPAPRPAGGPAVPGVHDRAADTAERAQDEAVDDQLGVSHAHAAVRQGAPSPAERRVISPSPV
jgi:hypothetical protein